MRRTQPIIVKKRFPVGADRLEPVLAADPQPLEGACNAVGEHRFRATGTHRGAGGLEQIDVGLEVHGQHLFARRCPYLSKPNQLRPDSRAFGCDIGRCRARGLQRPATLGITWTFEPSINFYRQTRQLDWLAPVLRNDFADKPYDYYLVAFADVALVRNVHTVLLDDAATRALLARATADTAPRSRMDAQQRD